MPANSRKQTPTKNSLSAREMWLQAVKGRSSYAGANRKGGMSTKKTPNEYWVGTLRRSQGLLYILNFCIYSPIKQQIMHFTCFLFKLIYVLMSFVRKSFIFNCRLYIYFKGLQNEIAAMDTFGKNGPSSEAVPFLSTSHYLREKAGLEKPSTSRRAANGFESM